MSRRSFVKGAWVVYCKTKYATYPSRRAKNVVAVERGDGYNYSVDKFWVVANVLADGKLLLQTRRGKQHVIDRNDPNLRLATLWERIRHRARFKQLQLSDSE